MIRFFLLAIVVVPLTVWHGLRMVWVAARSRDGRSSVCDSAPRAWARTLLRVAGVDVVLENVEAIDPDRAQILVANHTSWFDVLALAANVPGRFVFVAKKELRKIWIFGKAIEGCGHVFVDRQDRTAAVESLEVARRTLERTTPTVIMFPEGTRSPTGELQAFKKGAFVLAIQTGVEIVPAVISGSREVLPKGSYRIVPGTIHVLFGGRIPVEGYALDSRNALREDVRNALLAMQSTNNE